MKLKIAVNLNRIPDSYHVLEDFEKARLYHFKHNVDIEFVFLKVSIKGYTSTYDIQLKRWLIRGTESLVSIDKTADVNLFVFDQAEWSTGTTPPLQSTTPNGCCYLANNKPYITIGTYPVDHNNGQTWIQIAHEVMHALVQGGNIKGFGYIQDVMDTYIENSNPDSPTGNFSQQWKLLQKYIAAGGPVVLTRQTSDDAQTLGSLSYGSFNCKTLERPWKDNKPNISCIPKGLYKCKWTWSMKFLKYTYEVTSVPGRSGIRFHTANFFFNLLGCISLGTSYVDINTDGKVDIINSGITIQAFQNLMGKKDFDLLIQ